MRAAELLAELTIEPADKVLTERKPAVLRKQWSRESNNSTRELRMRLSVAEKYIESRRLRIALGLASLPRDETEAAFKEANALVTQAFVIIAGTGRSCTVSANVLRQFVQGATNAYRRISRAELQPKHGRGGQQNRSKISARR